MRLRALVPAAAALAAMLLASTLATAQEVTLRAVSAFAENGIYVKRFEGFMARVNEAGKGSLKINFIGGPKAMPTFEVGNAVKNGVVDMALVTGAFYTNVFPEADAWKLTERPIQELRQNGAVDYMQRLYGEKMNAHFLARMIDNTPFHVYLNKPISGPRLDGLKLRITPVYRDFFQAQGATVIQTAPGEVYTALERGVVDGYGWPISGIFDLGWHEKTKFRVDPGFYTAEVSVLVNKRAWDRLSEAQRKVLTDAGAWLEGQGADLQRENDDDVKRQAAAGIQVIRLEGQAGQDWSRAAVETGWAGIIRQSPEHGPKLRELFTKAKGS